MNTIKIAQSIFLSLCLVSISCTSDENAPTTENKSKSAPAEKTMPVEAMSNERLHRLLKDFNEDTEGDAKKGFWRLVYEKHIVQVITDKSANRMRIIVPIIESEKLSEKLNYRLLQANFDSALDARYAIANGVLFSTFIHPLASLNDNDFFSGLAQTINLAETFGSTFSSGAIIFQGGDSQTEQRKLFDAIMKKGEAVSI